MNQALREFTDFPWGAAAILLLLAVLLGGLARLGAQPLRIELYGDYGRTGAPAIAERLDALRAQGFFGLRHAEVQQALADLPWLEGVETEFLWPDRLALALRERQPLANLVDGGVLAADGRVLPVEPLPSLPQVRAAAYRLGEIAALMQEISSHCAGCQIAALDLRAGNQLAVQLAWDGRPIAIELGRPDWAAALKRLTAQALPALRPELDKVAAIDLRHRHSFAVRWVEAPSTEDLS